VNIVDLVLLLAAVTFLFAGYRQGFIVGALAFVGFLGGGLLGMLVVPPLLENVLSTQQGDATIAVVAIVGVLLLAWIGQLIASLIGTRIRALVTWEPARVVDSGAGAVVSVAAMLLVAWALGTAVASSSVPVLAREVRNSEVLAAVSRVMPATMPSFLTAFQGLLDDTGFPDVFAGIAPERIEQVDAPTAAVLDTPALQGARPSVVKILGIAESCDRQVEGSGFVYADDRVMTNAHVVAGVTRPRVVVGDDAVEAEVVAFDSQRDLAVLSVPDLDLPALPFSGPASTGDDAVIAGYPGNGPFTAVAARIRGRLDAIGSDIYGAQQVRREVYAVRSIIEPGNSGGPLLAPDGTVLGVVFAASVEDAETGYALTAAEAASVADAGRAGTAEVGTGACVG
jgi:S1-C subfamily serine protease